MLPALGMLGATVALAVALPVWLALLWKELQSPQGLRVWGSRSSGGTAGAATTGIAVLAAAAAAAGGFWTELETAGEESFPSLGVAWPLVLLAASGTVAFTAGFCVALLGWSLAGRQRPARLGLALRASLSRLGSHPGAARARGLVSAHPFTAPFLFFLLLAAASRPASYAQPLGRDVGQYLYVGDVLLNGGAPYVDAANNKGPLTYVLFALVSLVANRSPTVVQLSLVLFTALAATALAALVGRFAGRPAGVLAGATMAVLAANEAFRGTEPNTEQYGLAAMVGAWWLATRGRRGSAATAGAVFAAAVLINPWFAIVGPFVAYELWRAEPPRDRRVRTAAAAVGALSVMALALGALALTGAIDDMVEQVGHSVRGATQVAAQIRRETEEQSPVAFLFDVPLPELWVLGLLGCLAASGDRGLRRAAAPAGLWMLVIWARAKFAGYAFDHYYFPALVGISAGMALGLASLWRRRFRLVLLLAVGAVTWSAGTAVIRPQTEKLGESPTERGTVAQSLSTPVATFIRERTGPGERIFVAGSTPIVYWLSGRLASTRIFDDGPQRGLEPEYRAERARDLVERPPAAIAYIPRGRDGLLPPYVRPVLRRYRFHVAYRLDGARVWLRSGRNLP